MPLYEYECKKCGHRFEKIQLYSAKMVKKCPECGGQVEQMISAPAVQFKGSGWYVTDYAKKSSSPGASGSSGVVAAWSRYAIRLTSLGRAPASPPSPQSPPRTPTPALIME